MNQQEYIQRALETESKPDDLAISLVSLDMTFAIGIATGEVMNKLKRAMFYKKPLESAELDQALHELAQTAMSMGALVQNGLLQSVQASDDFINHAPEYTAAFATASLDNVNKRLLHGVIGEMSETAEKFEALREQLYTGKLDIVNFGEEMGDQEWYGAIQYDELAVLAKADAAAIEMPAPFDLSPDAVRARNIQKLQDKKNGRYKTGTFDAAAAVDRDTAAERVILESSDVGNLGQLLAGPGAGTIPVTVADVAMIADLTDNPGAPNEALAAAFARNDKAA